MKHILDVVPQWSKYITTHSCVNFRRLRGNSNACFKVSLSDTIQLDSDVPRHLLYRRYEQTVVQKEVEQAIFLAQSQDHSGLKLYHQNDEYRIEEFFISRPITLWEMRNPLIQKKYADRICNFNFNKWANIYVSKVMTLDNENTFLHQFIRTHGKALKEKMPFIKKSLQTSNTEEHRRNLKIAEKLEKTFLFEGYEEYFMSLIPISSYSSLDIATGCEPGCLPDDNPFPTVLCHNDIH